MKVCKITLVKCNTEYQYKLVNKRKYDKQIVIGNAKQYISLSQLTIRRKAKN